MRSLIVLGSVALLLAIAGSARSHHSFPAHYDGSKSLTILGAVEEFRFENPHARIYLLVTEDDVTVRWLVEMGSRNGMYRAGWRQEHIAPGDIIRVSGAPGWSTPNTMHADAITTADGGAIGPGPLNGRTTAN